MECHCTSSARVAIVDFSIGDCTIPWRVFYVDTLYVDLAMKQLVQIHSSHPTSDLLVIKTEENILSMFVTSNIVAEGVSEVYFDNYLKLANNCKM